MNTKANKPETGEDIIYLLQYLVAIELYRAGLSQNEIRRRLGIDINTVNKMLKGVSRHVETRTDDAE
jgi:transposase-like protein